MYDFKKIEQEDKKIWENNKKELDSTIQKKNI